MMVGGAEESQLKGPIDLLAPYTFEHALRGKPPNHRMLRGTNDPVSL